MMNKKHTFALGLVIAACMLTGCDNDSVIGSVGASCDESNPCVDDAMICVAGACAYKDGDTTPCEGDDCGGGDKPCVGDNCGGGDKPCVGDNCGGGDKPCVGDNCGGGDEPCVGDNCGGGDEPCVGDNCGGGDEPCVGDDCGGGDEPCVGDNCGGGVKDPELLSDKDGDGISDKYDRCDVDTDGDGLVNCEDPDSDGDTIPDSIEKGELNELGEPADSMGYGEYNFLSEDSDGNGIPDSRECHWGIDLKETGELATSCDDTDGNGVPDFADKDNDGDKIADILEIYGMTVNGTPSGKVAADCDGDGQLDNQGTPDAPFVCKGAPAFLNKDSDGDTIPDRIETNVDSDKDGKLDIYSLDSDGDGVLDSVERCAFGKTCTIDDPVVETNGEYNYRMKDSDKDGLADGREIYCENLGVHSSGTDDVDGDGFKDAAEYAAAIAVGKDPASLLCDPGVTVKSVFDFYFELPYQGDEDNDTLLFTPKVSKLDLVFNVDTTGSMGSSINSVKTNISSIISKVRSMVTDSGFALTNFDDFTGGMCHNGNSTCGSGSDLPFRILGAVSTNEATVTGYTKDPLFTTRSGNDGAESGTESLYQIATGKGVTWYNSSTKKSVPARANAEDTWGGVDFRKNTLPVVVHVTDIYSHESSTSKVLGSALTNSNLYYTECTDTLKSTCVEHPHYTDELVPVLKSTGVRVISLNVGSSGDNYQQMTTWSRESNAVVPVCAFKKDATNWSCGENKCCLGSAAAPTTVNGKADQCILKYTGSQSEVSNYISQGVDALVKYGTYEVSTQIVGNPIPGKSYGTECFIKKVEALAYIPPKNEPEKSCNPVAQPFKTSGSKSYNDGFNNFATGTSDATKSGAQLTFNVVAENDTCVEGKEEAQVFEATIRVINPTTGLLFDEQKVSIIVPAVVETGSVEY